MRKLLHLALLLTVPCFGQTTTVTISNTVQLANAPLPGINMGTPSPYGQGQVFKQLNALNGGYFSGAYYQIPFPCVSPSGTTGWGAGSNTFPNNAFVGAPYTAISASTGLLLGTGTITSSNTSGGFGLSNAMTQACSPNGASGNDIMIVRLRAANTIAPPTDLINETTCSSTTVWNTTDTSPASQNTYQSVQLPNTCALDFSPDALISNGTNTNSTLAATQVPWINLNGNYTASFKAKCYTPGCSLIIQVGRGGGAAYVPYVTVTPSYSATPGVGWNTYYCGPTCNTSSSNGFTASETGTQTGALYYQITATGTVLLQDTDVIESSTLSGNTTVYRDAVVYELQQLHPGSLRFMDGSDLCSDVPDQIGPDGNNRWCSDNTYQPQLLGYNAGYADRLALCQFINADCWLTVGPLSPASDWTTLVNWLSTSGWISTFAGMGKHIYLEDGNENWNFTANGTMWQGNGLVYGYTLGQNMTAARAASGYNSSVIKLVANSWLAPGNGYGPSGFLALTMQAAGCTAAGQPQCPDFVDNAPYTFGQMGSYTSSGSNVSTSGSPFVDFPAELVTYDSITTAPSNWYYANGSVSINTAYGLSTYGIGMAVYEMGPGLTSGAVTPSQLQMDQITGSVGAALDTEQNFMLLQRDAGVTGPMHFFTLEQNSFPYNSGFNPQSTVYGLNRLSSTGPGQTQGSANVDRPVGYAFQVYNNGIGSNNNLMAVTQSGTPTYSYAGDQDIGGQPTILAATVPYVNCSAYANSAKTNWTTICFNNNLTSSESITLAGAGAPTGSVTQTIFPGSGNVITDHNENTYLGPSSVSPVVALPSSTSTSGTSYTIPAASMMTLTYTVGTPQAATPTFSPGAGTYSSTQTVTISASTGPVICWNTTGSPVTNGTTGCTTGTLYSGPVSVSSSETLYAVAGGTGYLDSSVGSAAYTITTAAATPTFSPVAGTYTGTQSVTLSTSTSGCSGYLVWNTTNAQSGGNLTGTSSTNPLNVATSETVYAQVQSCPSYTNSAIGSAAYTINPASTGGAVVTGNIKMSGSITMQ